MGMRGFLLGGAIFCAIAARIVPSVCISGQCSGRAGVLHSLSKPGASAVARRFNGVLNAALRLQTQGARRSMCHPASLR